MAHTRQQQKRVRQDVARNEVNTQQRSTIRTVVKAFEKAVAAGDKTVIADMFKKAMAALARGARKGLVTKGAAARKTSRMAAKIASK